jgi:hypothetical protein
VVQTVILVSSPNQSTSMMEWSVTSLLQSPFTTVGSWRPDRE